MKTIVTETNPVENVCDYREIFADRLKELIEINEITVKHLAEKTCITGSGIYGYLSKLHAPNLKGAIKVSDYFQCPLDFLFGFCDEYQRKTRKIVASVSERVHTAIDKSGKTRYRLARELNVADRQFSRWYHGKTEPSLFSLVSMAKILGCPIEYLAGRE